MRGTLQALAAVYFVSFCYALGALAAYKSRREKRAGEPSPRLSDTLLILLVVVGALAAPVPGVTPWISALIWVWFAFLLAFMLEWPRKPQPDSSLQ